MCGNILRVNNKLYPQRLKSSLKDYKDLYYIGDLSLLERESIAIVGSRKCTQYGVAVTAEIVKKAVERNIVVISGLAGGVDSIAHRKALEMGGDTIAVVGNGLDIIYPKSNSDIYRQIRKKGLILSEYSDGTPARKYHFPIRNRIISALADSVVIVEAKTRSGSLITAECAVEQGKRVYAVPGNITSVYSMGTNKLIRDGINILAVPEDAFQGYFSQASNPKMQSIPMGKYEEKIFKIVAERGEVSVSELAGRTMSDPALVNSVVTVMEMKGLVFCEMGKVILANFR